LSRPADRAATVMIRGRWTSEAHTVATGHSVAPASWQARLEELLGRIADRFARVESRRRAKVFVLGLLADLPRKELLDARRARRGRHPGRHAAPAGRGGLG
jgi:hypothetical protein